VIASHTSEVLRRFRKTAWPLQRTFRTPRKRLEPFVAAILSSHGALAGGCVSIDSVVFEPRHLAALLAAHNLPPTFGAHLTLTTEKADELVPLLQAAFADSPDFVFVPMPRPFVCYADHDEYATFYAHTKSNVNRVATALLAAGVQEVDYRRD
jgi:hypothetical protein